MLNDFRFGFRMLLKNPAFTAVAVLSLALGIGANTAIFQLLNAVRLKTLPIRDAQQLAQVRLRDSDVQLTRGNKGVMRYSPSNQSTVGADSRSTTRFLGNRCLGNERISTWPRAARLSPRVVCGLAAISLMFSVFSPNSAVFLISQMISVDVPHPASLLVMAFGKVNSAAFPM